MKIYDYITRVSKMGSRRESDESTMTVDDQREQCVGAIEEKGGRVGKEHKALNQSGRTSVDSKPYREALARILRGESHGIAVAFDDRLARDWRKLGRYYDEMEAAGAKTLTLDRKRMVARGLLDYVEVCEAEGRGRAARVEARLEFYLAWRVRRLAKLNVDPLAPVRLCYRRAAVADRDIPEDRMRERLRRLIRTEREPLAAGAGLVGLLDHRLFSSVRSGMADYKPRLL
jgi:hypothetical protein